MWGMKGMAQKTGACLFLTFLWTIYTQELQAQKTHNNMVYTERVYFKNEKYTIREEESFPFIEPSYKIDSLSGRLDKYNFLSCFDPQALTIQGYKIVEYIDTNHIKTWANPVFVYHDWRFLHVAVYLHQRILELENMYNEKMAGVEQLLKDYHIADNKVIDIIVAIHTLEEDSLESIKKNKWEYKKELSHLQSEKGIWEKKLQVCKKKNQVGKDSVDLVWVKIVELFPIIEEQLKELSGTNYSFSEAEREIIKKDYESAKNIFKRLFSLHRKSFRGSQLSSRLFQMPGIPGWVPAQITYDNIEGISPDPDETIITVRSQ